VDGGLCHHPVAQLDAVDLGSHNSDDARHFESDTIERDTPIGSGGCVGAAAHE